MLDQHGVAAPNAHARVRRVRDPGARTDGNDRVERHVLAAAADQRVVGGPRHLLVEDPLADGCQRRGHPGIGEPRGVPKVGDFRRRLDDLHAVHDVARVDQIGAGQAIAQARVDRNAEHGRLDAQSLGGEPPAPPGGGTSPRWDLRPTRTRRGPASRRSRARWAVRTIARRGSGPRPAARPPGNTSSTGRTASPSGSRCWESGSTGARRAPARSGSAEPARPAAGTQRRRTRGVAGPSYPPPRYPHSVAPASVPGLSRHGPGSPFAGVAFDRRQKFALVPADGDRPIARDPIEGSR
jgi:hypothetical protein